MNCMEQARVKELVKENKDLKKLLGDKRRDYEELKEKYKEICAAFCFTMDTDWS